MIWSIKLSSGHVADFPLKEHVKIKKVNYKKYDPLCKTVLILGGESSSSNSL